MTTATDSTMELVRRLAAEHGDTSYADFITGVPFSYYQRRVRALGFADLGRVLDVGCGYGHWTAALAEVNDEVVGIDRAAFRVSIAKELAATRSLTNVVLEVGDATDLPYPDESFQGVFCYSVFMFLDRVDALSEFRRVLSPGGRLYICTSARGWWLDLWTRAIRDRNPGLRRSAFRGWASGSRGRPPHATGTRKARRLLAGWRNVQASLEGQLGDDGAGASVYAGRWLGIERVVEFVAEKPEDGGTPEARIENESLALVARTLARRETDLAAGLELHPQPRPALDLVHNTDSDRVAHALRQARASNRLMILRSAFEQMTRGTSEDAERVAACVTFAQKHFFHHFAGQPMEGGAAVQDPVAAILIGSGRCGTSARFLVDLFSAGGLPARLVSGAAHTCAEVLCEGRWVLADANLFPPGVLPTNRQGLLLSLEDAIEEPDLLNRVPSYINYHHEYIDSFLAAYPETREQLEPLLRRPLLPASGYFGAELYAGDPGVITRHAKADTPTQWASDEQFGWRSLEAESIRGPQLPVEQRPTQVSDLRVEGESIVWTDVAIAGERVSYRMIVSPTSRGWDYDRIPDHCTFAAQGVELVTEDPRVSHLAIRTHGEFVTVLAENADWAGREIFYLPSREFRLP